MEKSLDKLSGLKHDSTDILDSSIENLIEVASDNNINLIIPNFVSKSVQQFCNKLSAPIEPKAEEVFAAVVKQF
jgi:hypothetical protein